MTSSNAVGNNFETERLRAFVCDRVPSCRFVCTAWMIVGCFLTGIATAEMNPESLFEAAAENSLAIRNYDVRVKEWSNESPIDSNLKWEIVSTNQYRLVMNYDAEHCLFVRYSLKEMESSIHKKIEKPFGSEWSLKYFHDGKKIQRGLTDSLHADRPITSTFADFCKKENIPMVEFGGLSNTMLPLRPRDEMVRIAIDARVGSTVSRLGDGHTRLIDTTTLPNGQISEYNLFFSPKTWLPIKLSTARTTDGKRTVTYEHTVSYEPYEQIFRPVEIVYSRQSFQRGKGNTKIECSKVGTIQIQWLQMNAIELEYPKLQQLGAALHAWNDFVDINKPTGLATSK